MTIIYCDICGKELKHGNAGCRVLKACDDCAMRLINHVKGILGSVPAAERYVPTGTTEIELLFSYYEWRDKRER